MTYGIAAYKVTPQFCEDEVNYITSLGGIEIKYNQELGKNISLAELKKNLMPFISGSVLVWQDNWIFRVKNWKEWWMRFNSFMISVTKAIQQIPVGDKVAVIGMGMTAIDAATQAKRLGAKEVTMVYRRTQDEMPCTEFELNIAKLDGCNIIWLAAPKEVIGEKGKVKALVCSEMELGEPDASGRRSTC